MGAPLSEEMKREIIETWSNMKSIDYEPLPKEVRASVFQKLEKQGYKESEIPALRTFQEYLKRARKRQLTLNQESKVDEQKPWNIETLDELPLPSESIPFVLQLWRYCKNLGPELTIRQAKWAARLYYLIKDFDIAEQLIHVIRYSREEELSLLSGTPMRTDQLNSLLVMQPWERLTLAETDTTFKANMRINHSFTQRGRDGGITEEFCYAFADIFQSHMDMWLEDKYPDDIERVRELNVLIGSLPSSSKYFPDFESRMVYLRHLAKLSQLPYWRTAEPEEIHALIIDLRSWVVSQAEEKIERENNPKSESLFGYMLGEGGSFPLDIYLRAGFSLDKDTEELEAEIRKTHPNWFEQEGDKQ